MFTDNDFKGVWGLITFLVWTGIIAIGAVVLGAVGFGVYALVRWLS